MCGGVCPASLGRKGDRPQVTCLHRDKKKKPREEGRGGGRGQEERSPRTLLGAGTTSPSKATKDGSGEGGRQERAPQPATAPLPGHLQGCPQSGPEGDAKDVGAAEGRGLDGGGDLIRIRAVWRAPRRWRQSGNGRDSGRDSVPGDSRRPGRRQGNRGLRGARRGAARRPRPNICFARGCWERAGRPHPEKEKQIRPTVQ